MASEEHQDKSVAAKAVWPLLFLTAGLHAYVDALWEFGAPETQLRQMTCENPARLLRIAA